MTARMNSAKTASQALIKPDHLRVENTNADTRPWTASSGPYWFTFLAEPRPRGTLIVRRSSTPPVGVGDRLRYTVWRPGDEILCAPMTEVPAKVLRRTLKDIEKDDVTALIVWLRDMSDKHKMRVVEQQADQSVDAQCVWMRLLELVEGGA